MLQGLFHHHLSNTRTRSNMPSSKLIHAQNFIQTFYQKSRELIVLGKKEGSHFSPGLGDGGELGDLCRVQRRDSGTAIARPRRTSRRRWRGWRRRLRRDRGGGHGGVPAPLGEEGLDRRVAGSRDSCPAVEWGGGGEEGAAEHRSRLPDPGEVRGLGRRANTAVSA